MKGFKEKAAGIYLIIAILLVWEFSVRLGYIDTPSVPKVSQIFVTWFEVLVSGELISEIVPSLQRVFMGYALAIAVGVPVGLFMGTNKFVYSLLEPLTELLRPIPSAAYVPVAILFLGIGNQMNVFVIFLSCVFPILLNTFGGVKGVDPVLIDTGRTFGYSKPKILKKIVLPSVLPEIFTGMRISLGIALIVVVVSEMIAGNSGIGYFILNSQQFFKIPQMFVGIFTLGIIGYLLNWSFLKLEQRVLRWRIQA